VGTLLLRLGFKGNDGDYRKVNQISVLVINIQKSSFGDDFFFNLGVFFRSLSGCDEKKVKHNQCHINMRLEHLLLEWQDDILFFGLLSEENENDEGALIHKIDNVFNSNELIERCDQLMTLSGARELYRSGILSGGLLHKDVRRLLGDSAH